MAITTAEVTKAMRKARRSADLEARALGQYRRAVTLPNRKRQADRRACRGQVAE